MTADKGNNQNKDKGIFRLLLCLLYTCPGEVCRFTEQYRSTSNYRAADLPKGESYSLRIQLDYRLSPDYCGRLVFPSHWLTDHFLRGDDTVMLFKDWFGNDEVTTPSLYGAVFNGLAFSGSPTAQSAAQFGPDNRFFNFAAQTDFPQPGPDLGGYRFAQVYRIFLQISASFKPQHRSGLAFFRQGGRGAPGKI